ncbi:hypothetical protein GGQ55_002888 [Geodermatophilus daqingensis]|uniref:Peptidase M4 domain-containing protein n=2 Tax=Petropleomorpha daqingensis TaxID=2026353 RepID=A0A853CFK9_9ACTN|nr:hypothetical protein [Petropleomorpha daqingensis]
MAVQHEELVVDVVPAAGDRNLLTQETVAMTVLAQDPTIVDDGGPIRAPIPVPAGRLERGPCGERFRVVSPAGAPLPVVLHAGDPWRYVDRWSPSAQPDATALPDDPDFRAQNVYAVAAHTLALFEQQLGRPVPWHSGLPQLDLVPQAAAGKANAFYSRERNCVLFGWLPVLPSRPSLYTALSYDVIAHEVSHAILDGLRPRFTQPSLPDQLAFHEALADLVALLSVFTVPGVALRLLAPKNGRILLPPDAEGRARTLMASPLARLGEQVGAAGGGGGPDDVPALRWSGVLDIGPAWRTDPQFDEPHRRAEVLVAAFLQTLVTMWAGRLEPLRIDPDGVDADRVGEEGVKSAEHLLGMLLRALDYLPPVDLTFPDVLDAVLTADRRLAPDDAHGYRTALEQTFARFGITPPPHRIVDSDGVAAPTEEAAADARPAGTEAAVAPDPDAGTETRLRYEHLNLAALRTSPDEVFSFVWNNAALLSIDVRYPTRVERVLSSTRVGPDGLVVTEILADYTQVLRTTAGALPPGIAAPAGAAADEQVELWGGGVLVFDQFGRYRLHQRQPLLDIERQTDRLAYLARSGIRGVQGVLGATDGPGEAERFARLHEVG